MNLLAGYVGFCYLLMQRFFLVCADVPYSAQYGFQDPATIYFENMVNLHHDIMMFLVLVCIFVFYMLLATAFNFNADRFIHPPVDVRHNTLIEIIWTLIPTAILISIAIPSFALLYSLEEYHEPYIHIKVTGNQWYWVYECSDFYDIIPDPWLYTAPLEQFVPRYFRVPNFRWGALMDTVVCPWFDLNIPSNYPAHLTLWYDPMEGGSFNGYIIPPQFGSVKPSFENYADFIRAMDCRVIVNKAFRHSASMLSEADVLASKGKALRLLSTDNILVLPAAVWVKLSVTANDVLHSWTIPSFGVKLDGCPGRLNSTLVYIKREGVFYGQCSEICGVQHAFMPIEVHVVESGRFLNYALRRVFA